MKILLIEDDRSASADLTEILTAHHYIVNSASDGEEGLQLALGFAYDLILLNLNIPQVDGINFCRQLRSQGNRTPILLLTTQSSTTEQIKGLEAGADDYVVKPFDPSELLARIRALLRREQAVISAILTWGELSLNTTIREVKYAHKLLRLTPKEYGILELLLKYPQRVFSRSAILDKLWDFAEVPGEETVTSHIKALRQKLKSAGATQDLIETVYGLGYRLKPTGQPSQPTTLEPDAAANTPSSKLPQDEANEFMLEFWEQFQSSFAEQIQLLEQTVQALSTDQVPPDLWQTAKQECHKLVGSLGVFGYPHGSVLARELEEILGSPLPLPGDKVTKALELVALLHQEVERPPQLSTAIANSTPQMIPVLLVDDDQELAEQLKAEVKRENPQDCLLGYKFRVDVVTDPIVASLAIAQSPPKVILLNLSLSNGSQTGLTLLQELAEECPQIPVVVLTGGDSLSERVEAARLGVRAFLQKPIGSDRILQTLHQVLDQSPAADGKVLIVDDDPLILASVRNLLQPWGLQVQTLEDPQQFLEVLNSFLPDLLVLDLEMPNFSGIDLCQVVRNDPEWGDLPILFLTAHTEVELIYEAFAVGGDDYIRKPIVEPELVTRIISRLDRVRLFQQLHSR